jgi:hypothetical protein
VARKATSNAAGLERTIKALSAHLDEEDEALIALARGLAGAVDADPANAALWREYRAAVGALVEAGTDHDVDDDTKAFLFEVRTPVRTKVGDTPKR